MDQMDQIKLKGSKLNKLKRQQIFHTMNCWCWNFKSFHFSHFRDVQFSQEGICNIIHLCFYVCVWCLKSLTDITRKLLIIWRCWLHTLCKILKWWRMLLLLSMKLRTCKFWKNFKIIAANAYGHIHGYILKCVDITIDNSMHPKKMEWRWYGLILRYQCQTDLWGYRCFTNIVFLGIIRILRIFPLCIWQTLHDLKHK